jgi:hypothetical protein
VKASLPTAASPSAAPTTSAYPDHETMVARMTKINEVRLHSSHRLFTTGAK